jgi:hypothetical protein
VHYLLPKVVVAVVVLGLQWVVVVHWVLVVPPRGMNVVAVVVVAPPQRHPMDVLLGLPRVVVVGRVVVSLEDGSLPYPFQLPAVVVTVVVEPQFLVVQQWGPQVIVFVP